MVDLIGLIAVGVDESLQYDNAIWKVQDPFESSRLLQSGRTQGLRNATVRVHKWSLTGTFGARLTLNRELSQDSTRLNRIVSFDFYYTTCVHWGNFIFDFRKVY